MADECNQNVQTMSYAFGIVTTNSLTITRCRTRKLCYSKWHQLLSGKTVSINFLSGKDGDDQTFATIPQLADISWLSIC